MKNSIFISTKFKFFAIAIIFGFFACLSDSCKKDEKEGPSVPGPLKVENSITPTSVKSGSSIHWEIKVSNSGGEAEITRIHAKEEFISGWAQGESAEVDLQNSNSTIGTNETQIVYSQSAQVLNTGETDVDVRMTVTVYSNAGKYTAVAEYKIIKAKKNKSSSSEPTLQSLIKK